MNEINLAQFDLNLLTVMNVLLEEKSVTRAAKRLHRTQSAISHALGRLREGLRDPVLMRMGNGLEPTPKARRLAGEVSRVLRHVSRILNEEGTFEASTTARLFTLSGPDFVASRLSALCSEMTQRAPRASLEVLSPRSGMLREVAEGLVDLAVAPTQENTPDGLKHEPLGAFDWAVFARRQHPARRHWNLQTWARYPHIGIRTPSAGESPVDAAAAALKLKRHIGIYLPHFLMAPPLLSKSHLLMTVPRMALEDVARPHGLVMLPCPLKLKPIRLSLYWSALLENDAACAWFRMLVHSTLVAPQGRRGDPP